MIDTNTQNPESNQQKHAVISVKKVNPATSKESRVQTRKSTILYTLMIRFLKNGTVNSYVQNGLQSPV